MSLNETGAFIVPHYNDGNEIELKWFGEALNSIKLQTDNDWKIIVIDDASTSEKAISFLTVSYTHLTLPTTSRV